MGEAAVTSTVDLDNIECILDFGFEFVAEDKEAFAFVVHCLCAEFTCFAETDDSGDIEGA